MRYPSRAESTTLSDAERWCIREVINHSMGVPERLGYLIAKCIKNEVPPARCKALIDAFDMSWGEQFQRYEPDAPAPDNLSDYEKELRALYVEERKDW